MRMTFCCSGVGPKKSRGTAKENNTCAREEAVSATARSSAYSFQPTEIDNFGFLLQILVGPEEGIGEESFDVMVCTPRWLIENHSPEDIVSGRHMLIMFRYDYRATRQTRQWGCFALPGVLISGSIV
jgi:Immunity protein 8